ncbi:hypothetical protein A2V71_00955 [Candidatus Berkelbacteria bacterium RBG_13_40_8]|uniref:Uncharacterized protein n=1 Tax=Candidatus Berkelbacteria bacterium RBG_13_40_8 TaxID=1797467 RepID=A0A1F5DP87_9BACT|nr:MAG: hypothetical protein A2V71_00955 [Candidatus Berkelbacteria bacterium RBG_13_40_8]
MGILQKIKHLPKRQQVLLSIFAFFIIAVIGIFIWAIITGKIKPLAADNQISNTATVTYQDLSGGTHTVNSNTVLTDIIPTTNATLALQPATSTVNVDSTFNVDIILNTGGQDTVATDAVLTYNSQELEVQDADNTKTGVQIAGGTLYATEPLNTVDVTAGKISYLGAIVTGSTTRYNGTGTLATIAFKALKVATPSSVNFVYTAGQTNDSNVATEAATDILGSVTNGSYTLSQLPTTINLDLTLQGRSDYSTTATVLKIYPAGQSTPISEKNDIVTDITGKSTFTINPPTPGGYDFQIKVTGYLTKKITSLTWTDPLALNYTDLRSGDLDGNNIVNSIDFTILNNKWGQADSLSDINRDNIVNSIDFALLNSNWFLSGQ